VFVGRHTQDKYDEFFACIRAAETKTIELEKGFGAMAAVANSYAMVYDAAGKDEQNLVGFGWMILGWLMMNAGCVLPEAYKDILLTTVEQNRARYFSPERLRVTGNFESRVQLYSEECDNTVAVGYRSATFREQMLAVHSKEDVLSEEKIAGRNFTRTDPLRTEPSVLRDASMKPPETEEEMELIREPMRKNPIHSSSDNRIHNRNMQGIWRECGGCGMKEQNESDKGAGAALFACTGGCSPQAVYCSKKCQKSMWMKHKMEGGNNAKIEQKEDDVEQEDVVAQADDV